MKIDPDKIRQLLRNPPLFDGQVTRGANENGRATIRHPFRGSIQATVVNGDLHSGTAPVFAIGNNFIALGRPTVQRGETRYGDGFRIRDEPALQVLDSPVGSVAVFYRRRNGDNWEFYVAGLTEVPVLVTSIPIASDSVSTKTITGQGSGSQHFPSGRLDTISGIYTNIFLRGIDLADNNTLQTNYSYTPSFSQEIIKLGNPMIANLEWSIDYDVRNYESDNPSIFVYDILSLYSHLAFWRLDDDIEGQQANAIAINELQEQLDLTRELFQTKQSTTDGNLESANELIRQELELQAQLVELQGGTIIFQSPIAGYIWGGWRGAFEPLSGLNNIPVHPNVATLIGSLSGTMSIADQAFYAQKNSIYGEIDFWARSLRFRSHSDPITFTASLSYSYTVTLEEFYANDAWISWTGNEFVVGVRWDYDIETGFQNIEQYTVSKDGLIVLPVANATIANDYQSFKTDPLYLTYDAGVTGLPNEWVSTDSRFFNEFPASENAHQGLPGFSQNGSSFFEGADFLGEPLLQPWWSKTGESYYLVDPRPFADGVQGEQRTVSIGVYNASFTPLGVIELDVFSWTPLDPLSYMDPAHAQSPQAIGDVVMGVAIAI